MLAHSRGGSGHPESVDVNALLAETVNLAYHGLRASDSNFNIAIESDYDAALPRIRAVPRDLNRVFLNIVNNGCYAAHHKRLEQGERFRPCLSVSTRAAGPRIEVRIRDNGGGIPKEVLPKIFNPFFTTKPAGAGTGLGLSLSYQIVVDQHRGGIHVDTREGEYTEFTITLPVAASI
jgi:signal transduction histidine kinase